MRASSSLCPVSTPTDLPDVPKPIEQGLLICQHCPLDYRVEGHSPLGLGSSLHQPTATLRPQGIWGHRQDQPQPLGVCGALPGLLTHLACCP